MLQENSVRDAITISHGALPQAPFADHASAIMGVMELITAERRGNVWLMGLNRAAKRNAFSRHMLDELALAYSELDRNPDLHCGLLFAHGDHFTAGVDLAEFGPRFLDDENAMAPPAGGVDPLGIRSRTAKPVVATAQGIVFTIGIELLLACDVRIGCVNARFSQLEVRRGLYPLAGATFRMPQQCGWGNAMRWLLTGDEFTAAEALRIGLIQEIAEPGAYLAKGFEIAERIAARAPLAVQATLASARVWRDEAEDAAAQHLRDGLDRVASSEDYQEGIRSFRERREAKFHGR